MMLHSNLLLRVFRSIYFIHLFTKLILDMARGEKYEAHSETETH